MNQTKRRGTKLKGNKKTIKYNDSNEQSRTELRESRWGEPSTKGDDARYLKSDVEKGKFGIDLNGGVR